MNIAHTFIPGSLCLFPGMGRGVAQVLQPDALRDAVFGKYVARHSLHAEAAIILHIWHHFEDRDKGHRQ